jgi:murein DD-endopeptidase MepM/ murein hydrolase activator NlpD
VQSVPFLEPAAGWDVSREPDKQLVTPQARNVVEHVSLDGDQYESKSAWRGYTLPSVRQSAPSCRPDDLRFRWPLPGVDGRDWVIINYVDLERMNSVLRDYDPGQESKTYDNHQGTDISVPNFRYMDYGFPVYAAADGIVDSIDDGNFDRRTSCVGSGNYVRLLHANGFRSLYYHFRLGSVAVAVGQSVSAGQQVGVVGSSGCSTEPHLHFEVYGCNFEIIDPFLERMWLDPPVYDTPLGLMDVILSDQSSFGIDQLKDPQPNVRNYAPGSRMNFGIHLAGGRAGDQVLIPISQPDGSLYVTLGLTFSQVYTHSMWYWFFNLGSAQGVWSAVVRLNGVAVKTYQFGVGSSSTSSSRIIDDFSSATQYATGRVNDVGGFTDDDIWNHGQ